MTSLDAPGGNGPGRHRLPLGLTPAALALLMAAPVLFTACGRRGELLGSIGSLPPLDSGSSGDGASDSVTSTVPRFTAPTVVASVSTPTWHEVDPTFTGDLLELVFASDRGGGRDLWVSRRATADAPWEAPTLISELATTFSEYGPAISLDGLRLWFTTDRDGSSGRIWQASRANRSAPWGAPQAIAEVANAPGASGRDFAPSVDAAETTMMFGSSRTNSQGYDIYAATRAGVGERWGTPTLVPGINATADDWDPFVAQGGLVVFFTSMRTGGGEFFWAARQSTAAAFAAPQLVTDLNSIAYDSDITLSADLTYVMFDSTRSGGSDLYEAHAAF